MIMILGITFKHSTLFLFLQNLEGYSNDAVAKVGLWHILSTLVEQEKQEMTTATNDRFSVLLEFVMTYEL
jgi:hypothetical protein